MFTKNLHLFILLISFIGYGQEEKKDTLYFNLDMALFDVYDVAPDKYYLKNVNSPDMAFFFNTIKTEYCLKSNQILNLDDYLKNSYYYKSSNKSYNLNGLYSYFRNYVLYFVMEEEEKDVFIKVEALYEIE